LATNRWLQPELLGALGLIELQAGPRCRKVVAGLRRIGAPSAALPFYEEHARVDPRHGRAWLDRAVAPVVAECPELGWRIVRGARWRSTVNARFLDAARSSLGAAPTPHPDLSLGRDASDGRCRRWPERRSAEYSVPRWEECDPRAVSTALTR
jgi:hypothetical protein